MRVGEEGVVLDDSSAGTGCFRSLRVGAQARPFAMTIVPTIGGPARELTSCRPALGDRRRLVGSAEHGALERSHLPDLLGAQ